MQPKYNKKKKKKKIKENKEQSLITLKAATEICFLKRATPKF